MLGLCQRKVMTNGCLAGGRGRESQKGRYSHSAHGRGSKSASLQQFWVTRLQSIMAKMHFVKSTRVYTRNPRTCECALWTELLSYCASVHMGNWPRSPCEDQNPWMPKFLL